MPMLKAKYLFRWWLLWHFLQNAKGHPSVQLRHGSVWGLKTEGTNWCKQTNTEGLTDRLQDGLRTNIHKTHKHKNMQMQGRTPLCFHPSQSESLLSCTDTHKNSNTQSGHLSPNPHKQHNDISQHGGLPWAHLPSNPWGDRAHNCGRTCVHVYAFVCVPLTTKRG